MEQRIHQRDGSVCVIVQEEALPMTRKLTEVDILRIFNWTPAQFETARLWCSFPTTIHFLNQYSKRLPPTWEGDKVMEWAQRILTLNIDRVTPWLDRMTSSERQL